MLVTKEIQIDMGHRIHSHKSKCRNIHGHRYKFEVGVDDKVIQHIGASDEGMVIDFSDLKDIMMQVIDKPLDHGFMIYEKDGMIDYFKELGEEFSQKIIYVPFIPTAENISKYIYYNIKELLKERNISILYVKVWETPTSTALYTKEDEANEGK